MNINTTKIKKIDTKIKPNILEGFELMIIEPFKGRFTNSLIFVGNSEDELFW